MTGATGFIGSAVLEALLADGYRPRLLVRSRARGAALEARGCTVVYGDLSQPAVLEELCDNADAVIHCAGTVRGRILDDFLPSNLEGTRSLARCLEARQASVPMLVLSSLAAREAHLSHYARSKRLAEAMLEDDYDHLDWTVLRPPPVYGPGDQELMPLFRLMARGLAPLPGSPQNRVSLLHVADLVDAVRSWLAYEGDRRALRAVFPIGDPEPEGYSWRDVADSVARVTGRRVRLWRFPPALLDAVARMNVAMAQRVGYSPMLTPEKLRELRHPDWVCDSSSLSTVLEWQPGITFPQGVAPLLKGKQR